jgi:hypothetical protein
MEKTIKKIKGQRGFGDSICLYPIVKYFSKEMNVITYTDHPEVFKNLKTTIKKYDDYDVINAGYLDLKKNSESTQFEDICNNIGADYKNIPFEIPNFAKKEKICLFRKLYVPLIGMKKQIEESLLLIPNKESYYKIIEKTKKQFKCFQFGNKYDDKFDNLENIDVNNNFDDLICLISKASLVITQIGHTLHLSEALGIKTHVIFSKKGLSCSNKFINTITPSKVLFTNNSSWEID